MKISRLLFKTLNSITSWKWGPINLTFDWLTRRTVRKTPSSQGAIEDHRKKGVRWEQGKACSVPSDRPLKFVYKKREIVTRFPLLLETRDHRIGKSSSVVSCNYDPMHKSVRVRFSSYSHRVSGNHHPSFFFLRFSALFLSFLLYSNHNTSFFTIFVTLACVLDACVQIAFWNAFTGGWTISLCSG